MKMSETGGSKLPKHDRYSNLFGYVGNNNHYYTFPLSELLETMSGSFCVNHSASLGSKTTVELSVAAFVQTSVSLGSKIRVELSLCRTK